MVAAWLAAWPALLAQGDRARLYLVLGTLGAVAVVVALAFARLTVLTVGIALLGGGYGLHLVVDGPALDIRAALVGAGLLLTGELASWSMELRREVTREPGRHLHRLAAELVLCAGGLLVSALVLAAADLGQVGGVAIELAGAVAAIALVWLAVARLRPS